MTIIAILGGALLLSLLFTPLVRDLALRWNLVDCPDGRRKTHARPTAVAGGIAIFFAGSIALGAAWCFDSRLADQFAASGLDAVELYIAALIIGLVGVVDDRMRLRGRQKLTGQLVAVAIVIHAGVLVRTVELLGWQIELGILALPVTAFWLILAINSFNLLDGMDGLLGTIGVMTGLGLMALALFNGEWMSACVAASLVGALGGFLWYNLPPASIFLGDAGSMLVGLTVGTLAITSSSTGAPDTFFLAAPVALLTLPFLDTAAAVVRRKLTGRSIYMTDRGHLHHCLLWRKFTNGQVLLCVFALSLVTMAGAMASFVYNEEWLAIASAAAVVTLLVATRLFGHVELVLLKSHFTQTAVSFVQLPTKTEPRQGEVRLQGSVEWGELWENLILWGPRLGLKTIKLDVNAPSLHEGYFARWDGAHQYRRDDGLDWAAVIPLRTKGLALGQLEVTGGHQHEPVWQRMATVMDLVRTFETEAETLVEHLRSRKAVSVAEGSAEVELVSPMGPDV